MGRRDRYNGGMRAVRFSTRALFLAVAVCAVIALLLSWAMRGGILGDLGIVASVSAAMGALIVMVHVAFFGLCQAAAARRERQGPATAAGEAKESTP
jgi:hypothetical protein